MKAGDEASFILECTGKIKMDELTGDSIAFWENDNVCYVRVAERTGYHKSYLGIDKENGNTQRVGDRNDSKVWLQFKLERVRRNAIYLKQ